MRLNELDLAYIYIGMPVRSTLTGSAGILIKIDYPNKEINNRFILKPGVYLDSVGPLRCMDHDEYHTATLYVKWNCEPGWCTSWTIQSHCDMKYIEAI